MGETELPLMTIGEISHKVTKGTTPTTLGGRFSDSGINFIKVESIAEGGRINHDKLAYIDNETHNLLSRSKLQEDDLLFTIAGTIGRVAHVTESILPANTNQAIAIIRPKKEIIDPQYLYYVLNDVTYLREANAGVVQSVQANFSLGLLANIRVPVPKVEVQRRIAHILGTLDDKIELNRRMNATLEAIARALFKSWFVDFDPVRAKAAGRPSGLPPAIEALFPSRFVDSELGEIPEGWEVKGLDQIADFLNGLALQKYPPETIRESLPVIKIREMRQGYSAATDRASSDIDSKYIIEDGDLLFSWSGSLFAKFWTEGRGALNQHLFKVTSKHYPAWFYYLWLQQHMPQFQEIAAGKATTMGHIQRHHLSAAKCLVPPRSLLDLMTELVQPMTRQLVAIEVESKTLARTRESLLPRLMVGDLL